MWKSLEVAEDDQKAFNEKLEIAGKQKAGQETLNQERLRLLDLRIRS